MSRSKKTKDEMEECIDDLRRLNESFENRGVSRNQYRKHGNFSEAKICELFGTFSEFLRVAGLKPTRAQGTLNNQAARAAASDNLQKVWQERLNYGGNYLRDSGKRWQIILGFNDVHDFECDPFWLRTLLDTAKRVQPDIIVSNGDHFDLPEFGKYPNDPRDFQVSKRVEAGNEIFRKLREVAPNAQIDLIEGNHEARIIRYFTECAPPLKAYLYETHGMDIRKFLKLDENQVNYIAKSTMAGAYTDSHIRQEVNRNFQTYYETVCAHHFPAGERFAMSGWNGHHHSHKVSHHHNAIFGPYEWHQFGAGHRRDATYTNGEKWSNGFGIIHVDRVSRQCQINYVNVGMTMTVVDGVLYTRREDEFYPGLRTMLEPERIIPFPENSLKQK